MQTIFSDLRTAAGLFTDMRKARKDGKEIVVSEKMKLPFIRSGGFFNTVEGCTLSCLDSEIVNKASEAFDGLPNEEKYRLQFSPKNGEFAERARLWRDMLKPVMTEKQYRIAMNSIIEWYIHIKRMRFEKGGAE